MNFYYQSNWGVMGLKPSTTISLKKLIHDFSIDVITISHDPAVKDAGVL